MNIRSGKQPDLSDLQLLSGAMELRNSGRRLEVDPITIPFTIDGCPFDSFRGNFVTVVETAGSAGLDSRQAFDAFRAYRNGRSLPDLERR